MNEENPKRKPKTWLVENGKLVGSEYSPPKQDEHKQQLRAAGCASDIFTAETPEEFHAIADTELEEMTKTPPTPRGCDLLESWRDFYPEMRRLRIHKNQWVHYRHRDATDDLERGSGMTYKRLLFSDKIRDTLRSAIYSNSIEARNEKPLEEWTLEDILKQPFLDQMKKACVDDSFKVNGAKRGRLTIETWGQSLTYRTEEQDKHGDRVPIAKTFNFTAPKIWEGLALLLENPGDWVDMTEFDKDFHRRFQNEQAHEFKELALEHQNSGGKDKGKNWRIKT